MHQPLIWPIVVSIACYRINQNVMISLIDMVDTGGNVWVLRWQFCLPKLATHAAQIRILDFFAFFIAPKLGVSHEPGVEHWKSFMTNDHNLIEFRWDWNTTQDSVQLSLWHCKRGIFTIHTMSMLLASSFRRY